MIVILFLWIIILYYSNIIIITIYSFEDFSAHFPNVLLCELLLIRLFLPLCSSNFVSLRISLIWSIFNKNKNLLISYVIRLTSTKHIVNQDIDDDAHNKLNLVCSVRNSSQRFKFKIIVYIFVNSEYTNWHGF